MAVEIQERDVGQVTILDVKGRLASDAGLALWDRIDSLVQGGRQQLLLNLDGVSFVDSGALGGLLAKRSEVQRGGGKLKLLNLTSRIADLMVTTKLEMVFDTFESEPEALSSFSAQAAARD